MSTHKAAPNLERRSPSLSVVLPLPTSTTTNNSTNNDTSDRQPFFLPRDPPHEAQPPDRHDTQDSSPIPTIPPPPNIQLHDPPHEAQPPGEQLNDREHVGWGDILQRKPERTIRIGFRNVRSLPATSAGQKNTDLIQDIQDASLDILGISEVNIAWQAVSTYDSLHTRLRSQFEAVKFITSNNQTDTPIGTKKQMGGTATGGINMMAYRVRESGVDTSKLGRWSWLAFRGHGGTLTRVLTLYRPCVSYGPTTTYQQQTVALSDQDRTENPRNALLDDLAAQLRPWHEAGNRIIVAGDFNSAVNGSTIQEFFSQFQMSEAILARHGNNAPNTCAGGRDPIDGIFCSDGVACSGGGYSSIGWGYTSTDHRLLWIDVPKHEFFGGDPPPTWQPKARRLRIDDPRIVFKYNSRKLEELGKKNAIRRLSALHAQVMSDMPLTTAMRRELNDLDKIRTDASLFAESKCRKFKKGNVAWSPQIQASINQIRYYRTCIRRYRYNNSSVNSRTLEKLFRRQSGPIALNEQQAINGLREAMAEYKRVKPQAREIRYTYLADLANAQAETTGADRSNILRQLQQREEQRRLGARMKQILGNPHAGVTEVSTQADDGQWINLNEQEAIEQCCITEGIRKRTQANNSPCLLQSQVNLLGELADTDVSMAILQGTPFDHQELHPDMHTLLPYWNTPESIRTSSPIDLTISLEDYKKGWKKQKENTSSQGLLHFGHFKASIYSDSLANFDRMFLEITLKTGHILPRWKKGTDVLIPKKANSNRVTDLRTICLLAADWNFGNKLLGNRIMRHAEKHGTIAPEQYGSRKNKSSIQHATNKALLFDIQRQKKQDSVLMILDAEACYDRIPLHIASLCLRRQGLPLSAVRYMFQPIYEMQHNIRTTFGESTQHYSSREHRLHGILQGNGAGPCIWVMVSSPLLEHLRHTQHGIYVRDTNQDVNILIPAFAFVDDVDVVETTLKSLFPLLRPQSSLTTWSRDLWTIGGNLKWSKCFWQWLVFVWNGHNRWKIQRATETDEELTIHTADGNQVILQRNEVDSATLALGIMFSIDGSMKDEVALLKDRVTKWCDRIRTKKMSKKEVWYALTSCIMRTINYPLMATSMTKKEIHQFISPLLHVALPKAGYNRKISHDLVFSSKHFRGLGLTHPWDTQGVEKLCQLIAVHEETQTNMLMRESFQYCMKECGLGPNFLSTPFLPQLKRLLTHGIITTLWEYCSDHGIQVLYHQPPIKRFGGDDYLMVKFLDMNLPTATLLDLHYCRLYLQIETISDAISLDGTAFRTAIWNGERPTFQPNWPHQPRPTEALWRTWQLHLSAVLPCNLWGIFTGLRPNLQFFDYSDWQWFLSTDLNYLFRRTRNTIITYSRYFPEDQRRQRHDLLFIASDIIRHQLPDRIFPATTLKTDNYITVDSFTRAWHQDMVEHDSADWKSNILIYTTGSKALLRQELLNGNLLMVCDGSRKDPYGAAAYIITSERFANSNFLIGTTRATGNSKSQDSYRSELFGLLAGIVHIQALLEEWDLQNEPLTILVACDNLTALLTGFDSQLHPRIGVHYDQFDVISSIRRSLPTNITFKPTHVEGHQKGQNLDLLAQLNHRMDAECKQARAALENPPQPTYWHTRLPNWKWIVKINGELLCKDFCATIDNHISSNRMKKYLSNNATSAARLEAEQFDHVNWDAFGAVIKQQPIGRQRFMIKHGAGVCGVNKWRLIYRDRDNDECPRCRAPECSRHVYLCPSDPVKLMWDMEFIQLETFLEDINTSPDITDVIIAHLKHMYYHDPVQVHSNSATRQSLIGWQNFFEGLMHTSWGDEQQAFFDMLSIKRSGKQWSQNIIRYMWDLHHRFWTSRNNTEHQQDRTKLLQQQNDQISAEIELGFDGIERNRAAFSAVRLQRVTDSTNPEYKRCWLKLMQALRANPLRRPRRAPAVQRDPTQRQLEDFFHPQPPPT